MDINNIRQVYHDISGVLDSRDSQLAAVDRHKLEQALAVLESALDRTPPGKEVSAADRLNYLQLLIMIAEIIRNITGH